MGETIKPTIYYWPKAKVWYQDSTKITLEIALAYWRIKDEFRWTDWARTEMARLIEAQDEREMNDPHNQDPKILNRIFFSSKKR